MRSRLSVKVSGSSQGGRMKGTPPAFRMEAKYPSSKVQVPFWKFPVSPMTGA